jgi:anti-sigma B factor antagonist
MGVTMPSAEYNPLVVHLDGEIDVAAVEHVVHELSRATAISDDVIIDLRDVTFIDSTGVGLLAQALNKGATLVIDEAPTHVKRAIELAGLLEPLT